MLFRSSQYLEHIKSIVKELNIHKHVHIHGWVDGNEVLSNIQQSDLCCVPHHSNPHTDNTIPHKLYQYMLAKRPILVSSSPPLKRTVQAAKAGLVFEAGNPFDCSNKILTLINDPISCNIYAMNGYNYVFNQGNNWEDTSSKRLINAFSRLLKL